MRCGKLKTYKLSDSLDILNILAAVTWKRLNMETPQHGNVSKKRTHNTNLMSSSLIKKINNYFTINLGEVRLRRKLRRGPSAVARMAIRGPSTETRTG